MIKTEKDAFEMFDQLSFGDDDFIEGIEDCIENYEGFFNVYYHLKDSRNAKDVWDFYAGDGSFEEYWDCFFSDPRPFDPEVDSITMNVMCDVEEHKAYASMFFVIAGEAVNLSEETLEDFAHEPESAKIAALAWMDDYFEHC